MNKTLFKLLKKPGRLGFTLIEMLLVVSLLSMVGLAIYHAIADGVKVWEQSRKFLIDEDVAVFFEKLNQDIQNNYFFAELEFEGQPEKLSFPTIVRVPIDKKLSKHSNQLVDQMGLVEYTFRRDKGAIIRRQGNYAQALKHQFAPGRVLAQKIQNLKFTYILVHDGVVKSQHTLSGPIPISLQVDMDILTSSGQIRKYTRIINFPLGTPT